MYTITADINQTGITKFGFEVTAEEGNLGSSKTGTFFITNNNETKLTNNNNAVTHKSAGTSSGGSNNKNWNFDWEAPSQGTGVVTFYGSFMGANGNGQNTGDTYHSATLNINESLPNTLNEFNKSSDFSYNSIKKIIETGEKSRISVYNLNGQLIIETKNTTSLLVKNLGTGIYIVNTMNSKGKKNSHKISIK